MANQLDRFKHFTDADLGELLLGLARGPGLAPVCATLLRECAARLMANGPAASVEVTAVSWNSKEGQELLALAKG